MNKLIKITSILVTLVLLTTGIAIEKKLNDYRVQKEEASSITEEVKNDDGIDFAKLLEKNEDVKAWIHLPESVIDYPVVQAEDNEFYLHRGLDKKYSDAGTLFIDAACTHPFEKGNTVIYGHNLLSGAMFTSLSKFSDSEYMTNHSVFRLSTPYGEKDVVVVAYCNEGADSDLYDTLDTAGMSSEDFVSLIIEKAKVLSGEEFSSSDTFVTLSTCAYNFNEARHQVVGIVREPTSEVVEVKKDIDLNQFAMLQLVVGAVIFIAVISTVKGLAKKK